MTDWYQQTAQQVLEQFGSRPNSGLDEAEAARRLGEQGPNELQEGNVRSPWRILWEQFTATMVLILLGAALLSALLGEFKDAIAIGAIVFLFGLLGFIQEYRAEQAMAALKRLATPVVRVRRSGRLRELSARELVPGDIILLEAGNLVPADARLVENASLRVQEAALTGESEAVEKTTEAFPGLDLPLGDRRNLLYSGTVVTYGRGTAVVVGTGMRTELGKVAFLLQDVRSSQTPLQKRLDQLGRLLAVAGMIVAGLIFGLGLLRGEPVRDMLLTAVSVAVAVVPEGLPAVVTITLALGAQRMLRRQALIRKLPAVETLGSVTVICSDKTGTLTENRMTVMALDVAGHSLLLDETLRNRQPTLESGTPLLAEQPRPVGLLLAGGALCNDASLQPVSQAGRLQAIGDPTEGALLVAAARAGFDPSDLAHVLPRVAEIPFDSDRKRMTTIHQSVLSMEEAPLFALAPYTAVTKGAVDSLLEVSGSVLVNDEILPLTPEWRERILAANDRMAQEGMRVLGVAFRSLEAAPEPQALGGIESELTVIGLFGMIDPPRPEVKEAVQTALLAGIRPVMITGDHPLTARQIARELGIVAAGTAQAASERVITGQELNQMTDEDLEGVVDAVSVYARVSPEHKLRIVQALQRRGHIVAMTGDGVNDAPALKRADIGVAMGITGTDVSKEAAEMVLQDDNFATIVEAVEEGRTIYDNLRKFVKYSVAGNLGKVSVMLLAPLLGKPLPLLPLQLLWLNLLTDGLLGLALGMEPPEKDVMRRPPVSPQASIFSSGLGRHVLWVGGLIGALALAVGYTYWRQDPEGPWQTMVFSTLAFAQIAQAMATRSGRPAMLTLGENKPGLLIAAAVFVLQLAALYLPLLQRFLQTQPLSLLDLGISLSLGALVFLAIEAEKWWGGRRKALRPAAIDALAETG